MDDVVVDAGVVHDHHREFVACRVARLPVQKVHYIGAADGVFMHLKRQRPCCVVQGTQYVDPLACDADIGTVGLTQR